MQQSTRTVRCFSAIAARVPPRVGWVTALSPRTSPEIPSAQALPQARLRAAAWPVALLMVFHRVLVLALNGTPTDDFTTVYSAIRRMWEGQPVYDQAYHHVDPLFLYSPGATAVLAPVGLFPFDTSRTLFIVCNAAAIIAGLALLTRLVGYRLTGPVWPASIALAFATESVTNTLAFTNINGLLFLALCGTLWALIHSHGSSGPFPRWSWAGGLILGLAILIKPQFAPLVALWAVKRDWRACVSALGVPIAINAAAMASLDSTAGYFDKLLPYLAQTRDFANSSWAGARAYFDISGALYYPVWILVAALVGATLLALLRWHDRDLTCWALTTSGVIFVGIFFLSSLGQQYYSMWLFPLMFTLLLPRSVFHAWPAWLAAALFLAPLDWTSVLAPDWGRWTNVYIATVGWFLLIAASAGTVAGWFVSDRRRTSTPAPPVAA